MNREELKNYILEAYNVSSDYPWVRYPSNEVFRHPENKKWFALLMDVSPSVLTGSSSARRNNQTQVPISVLNVRVDPVLSGSLRSNPGIHPAYHMNKDKWLTLELALVPDDTIKMLLDMSYDATAPKKRGWKQAVHPTEKESLSESQADNMNRKLSVIQTELAAGRHPELTFLVFIPDKCKEGGSYRSISGQVKRIDSVRRRAILYDENGISDGASIILDDAVDIYGDLVNALDGD